MYIVLHIKNRLNPSTIVSTNLPRKITQMMKLEKNFKYLLCGGVTFLAITGATSAHAASFVSTYRPTALVPGGSTPSTTEIGTLAPSLSDPTKVVYTPSIVTGLQITDIALSATNQLYALTFDQLYLLTPGSNDTSNVVGLRDSATGLLTGGPPDVAFLQGLNGLGFDNSNNLYAIGKGGFYQIDPVTGFTTLKNPLAGFAPTAFTLGGDASDIVFDSSPFNAITNPGGGKFLATSGNNNSVLFSIALDGTPSKIGDIGFAKVAGLTFEGGTLLGYTANRQQIRIDLASGVGTLDKDIIGTALNLGGAASTAPSQVPEPSFAPGFIVLGTCFGARVLLKRKQKPIE
jgi:hypothetical protein